MKTKISAIPALPDRPDRSDLEFQKPSWGGIKLSVRGFHLDKDQSLTVDCRSCVSA